MKYCVEKSLKPVVDFRESLFDRCFAIDNFLANRMLINGYRFPSRFGRWCPVKVRVVQKYLENILDTPTVMLDYNTIWGLANRESSHKKPVLCSAHAFYFLWSNEYRRNAFNFWPLSFSFAKPGS